MTKMHKYDMSRRLDNGKWEVVGKGYQDSQTGRITLWVEPEKMAKIVKRQTESVPFILFDKNPEPVEERKHPSVPDTKKKKAHYPTTAEHMATFTKEEAKRTAKFIPKPTMPPPIVAKASDNWPPDFDDEIPFS